MATYGKRGQYKVDNAPKQYGRQSGSGYTRGEKEKYEAEQLAGIDQIRPPEFFRDQEYEEKQKEKLVTSRTHSMMPRSEEEPIESLKRVSPEIIGGLFDRLQFLEQRIDELQTSMKTREQLHTQMLAEIDKDVEEKQAMIRSISDMDEQRNLKLDISVLRREKRREYVQYWRDVLELRTELRELMEEFQVESKIADLFKNIRSVTNKPQPSNQSSLISESKSSETKVEKGGD